MRKLPYLKIVLSVMALALVFGSCDIGKLFSTSLAPDSNRIANAKPGNAKDAKMLLKQAKNDPGASMSLLGQIGKLATGATDQAERDALLGAAAIAGVQAGNVLGSAISSVATIADDLSNLTSGNAKDMAPIIAKVAENSGGHAHDVVDALVDIYVDPDNKHGGDVFTTDASGNTVLPPDAVAAMGDTEKEQDAVLGELALTVIVGSLNPATGGDALEDYADGTKSFEKIESQAQADAELREIFGDEIVIPDFGNDFADGKVMEKMLDANPSLQLLDAVVNSMSPDPADPIAKSLKSFWESMKGNS